MIYLKILAAVLSMWISLFILGLAIRWLVKPSLASYFPIRKVIFLALALSLLYPAGKFSTHFQNEAVHLLSKVPTLSVSPTVGASPAAPPAAPPPAANNKISEFLVALDKGLVDPDQLTPEKARDLNDLKNKTFTDSSEADSYKRALLLFESCQKTFMEDALISFQKKAESRSETYLKCFQESGHLFSRDKLIPEVIQKNVEVLISAAAQHRSFTSPSGKTQNVSEMALKSSISTEQKRYEFIEQVFR